MRFCMLTTFYPPAGFGGDAVQVRRLAHALADRGHEVTVLHAPDAYRLLGGRPPDSPPSVHPGVRVIAVESRLPRVRPVATYLTGGPGLGRGAIERAFGLGHDVIHFHNPSLLGGPGALRLGRAIKLYTAHEQWLICPTHVLFKNGREVCEEPQCWRCTLSYGRPPQPWRSTRLLERAMGELDVLLAPSRTSAALHARFAAAVRIEHLPHFIPAPHESVTRVAQPGARAYFLYVGRLETIKGVERLIDAFRRRRSEDLLIAGTGTLEVALRRRAADLPHVRFLGWVAEPELGKLYRGACAVVVPTAGHESFGLVAAEALAHGTPALVPAFGALGELAEISDAAIAFRSDAELDTALDRLAGDSSLRARLAGLARATYAANWTAAAHLRAYFSIIGDAARRRGDDRLARAASAEGSDLAAMG